MRRVVTTAVALLALLALLAVGAAVVFVWRSGSTGPADRGWGVGSSPGSTTGSGAGAAPADPPSGPSPDPARSGAPTPVPLPETVSGDAAAVLAGLPVREHTAGADYQRDAFGAGWRDPDRNGCDARNDILRRDLVDLVVRDGTQGCVVEAGTLLDPYTGLTIAFVKGPDSGQVQIDHVVPLALAWVDGAQAWTEGERITFANDPLNLLATSMDANLSKSASDASNWLPPDAGYRCAYVARQIAVKATYALPVAPTERAAMRGVLAGCPGQTLPVRD